MKRNSAAAFFVLACLSLPLAAEPVERVLTLDESIETGLHNNQELLTLQEQVGIAREQVKEANSQIYPKIDFNLSASRFNNAAPTVLPLSFNSLYLPATKTDLYYYTRLSLWQYLYAGGRFGTNVRLAEINLSQARSQADAVRSGVIRNVQTSFYGCLAAREKIRAYETAARPAAELARFRYEYDRQKLAFLDSLGLELTTMIDIEGTLTPPVEEYDLNKCLAWAFQYRPELRQTQFQETIDSLRVNLSLTERYPTVTLGASYEWVGDQKPLDQTNWNATININVPVFDGWASWARIRQQKYQAREGKIRRAKIEDRVRFEVRQAYLDYEFWKGRAAALSAQSAGSLESRLERIDALYRALAARASLEWAIGKAFFK